MKRFVKATSVVVFGSVALSALGALAVHDKSKDRLWDFVERFALFMPVTAMVLILSYRDFFISGEDGCVLGKERCGR